MEANLIAANATLAFISVNILTHVALMVEQKDKYQSDWTNLSGRELALL